MRTREDALNQVVELYTGMGYALTLNNMFMSQDKPLGAVKRAQDYHADGSVFHLDKGCFGENINVQVSFQEQLVVSIQGGLPTRACHCVRGRRWRGRETLIGIGSIPELDVFFVGDADPFGP